MNTKAQSQAWDYADEFDNKFYLILINHNFS
jgi:hypothetical protein